MPVLVVAGGKDKITDPAQAATLAKALESNGHANRFILNPDGEHGVPPPEWVKYSTDFLRDILDKK